MAKTEPEVHGGFKLWRLAYPQAMLLVYVGIVGIATGYLLYTYNRCSGGEGTPATCNPLQGLGVDFMIAGGIFAVVGYVLRMFRSTDY